MRSVVVILAWILPAVTAHAGLRVEVCFNYSCAAVASAYYSVADREALGHKLAQAAGPEDERRAIAAAVGAMYRIAGRQTPIRADRAGNLADAGVHGRMDCIDHSTTTTRLLQLLETEGWMRYHRVVEPARRTRAAIFQHFSAVIEEIEPRPERVQPESGDEVPDHVPVLLALCECGTGVGPVPGPVEEEMVGDPVPGARFVVDSWFVEHGEPAVILPLADWLKGEGPNVH